MSRKLYTDEFLISELQRFVLENGRNPRYADMSPRYGYPAAGAYAGRFGSWNNALELAGLEIYKVCNLLTGLETCNNCSCFLKSGQYWQYKNGQRLCSACYKNYGYRYGNLDCNSTVGRGLSAEILVSETLDLDNKRNCNLSRGLGFKYDLFDDKKYGSINVRSATLRTKNFWKLDIICSYTPDTFIFVGFSSDRQDVKHIWIVKSSDSLIYNKKGIGITNSEKGLKRAEPWEVDVRPYNYVWNNMNIDDCSYMINTKNNIV